MSGYAFIFYLSVSLVYAAVLFTVAGLIKHMKESKNN